MPKLTTQMLKWQGQFGTEYTDRNALTMQEMEELYKRTYGFTRTELNDNFLGSIEWSARILEVGSNIGIQLSLLQRMGFSNLYGIELQSYAIELSKSRTNNINIIQSSAFNIPFKNRYFDLVFTSGLLIHISPSDITEVVSEIHRCTRSCIWGLEHYAQECSEVIYRGQKNLLWNANYAKLYIDLFDDLELVKEERLKYLNSDNVDSIFLLRKTKE